MLRLEVRIIVCFRINVDCKFIYSYCPLPSGNVSSGDLKIAQSTAVQTAVVRGGRLLAQAATEFPDLTIFATANGPETEDLIESFVQFRLPCTLYALSPSYNMSLTQLSSNF